MKMGQWNRAGWLLAFAVLALATPQPGAAQQPSDQDCRCVDADGDAIENCSCFRMPRFEALMAPFASARPRLGISVSTSQGSDVDAEGARVTRVMEDGPADEAGIREDDVITRVDGRSLFDPLPGDEEDDFDLDESIPVQRLLAIARNLEPGQDVEIAYLRDGEARTAQVEAADLSDRPFTFVTPDFDADRIHDQIRVYTDGIRDGAWSWSSERDGWEAPFVVGPYGLARHGLDMIELSPGLGEYFGVTEGVLITDVDEESTLGLEPGDVLLSIGEREVTTPSRARRILTSYGGDEQITFRVQRDGAPIEVLGRLDD